ncbi:MAG: putative sulfate exporter family transporter [Bacteroidota bacterium]
MKRSQLFKTDDLWAILIGGGVLLFGLIYFIAGNTKQSEADLGAPFKTVAQYEQEARNYGSKRAYTSAITNKPGKWSASPLDAFMPKSYTLDEFDTISDRYNQAYEEAKTKDSLAMGQNYTDSTLNSQAALAIVHWQKELKHYRKAQADFVANPYSKLINFIILFAFFTIPFGLAAAVMGSSYVEFVKGFALIFVIAIISYFLAGNKAINDLGIGYAAWAIGIGLLISNTVGVPEWVKPALRTELFIKTALVLLGAEILLSKILFIGLPGIFVAWVVTPLVLVSTFWFGQKILKMSSRTLNITISADMSVCGVSAAVAVAAASNAKKEELTLAIGLSMLFTSIMMIVMPAFIKAVGIPEVLGGAWIGGTIDATGAVAAAGAFLGDTALDVAATIKMIQNILIGVVAFFVALYFTKTDKQEQGAKVGASEIWKRFPKFILGFIGASILFSIIYSALGSSAGEIIDNGIIKHFSKNLRGWSFCLAFVSIGLATNFKELGKFMKGGKPLVLYLCGQALNLALTLLMAYIMFYLVFPHITEQISR